MIISLIACCVLIVMQFFAILTCAAFNSKLDESLFKVRHELDLLRYNIQRQPLAYQMKEYPDSFIVYALHALNMKDAVTVKVFRFEDYDNDVAFALREAESLIETLEE